MRRGELVPDAVVVELVRERSGCLRCRGGFLLDGFPRTVAQAEALKAILADQGVGLDAVLAYELPLEEVVARLSGRRTCPGCKAVYHLITKPPQVENICDRCTNLLAQREDDKPESIRVRMQTYETNTRPLIDYYQQAGMLVPVRALGPPEAILERTLKVLHDRLATPVDWSPASCRAPSK
jgi:adenylate kinase